MTHACPGQCGTQVPRRHLACQPCWFRLPAELRDDINITYRTRRANPYSHWKAITDVLAWFRNNPAPEQAP